MTVHLMRELDRLKTTILDISAQVEENVQKSVQALEKLDVVMAEQVIDGDEVVDRMEVDLEEDCLKICALHQPVAADLRFIISVMKINNDLERIADLASNIAERTISLAQSKRITPPYDFVAMADKVQQMLKKSLDALVQLDRNLALEVIHLDDEVDQMYSDSYNQVKEQIRQHPEDLDSVLYYLSVSRHLERIADLATNIAEDVTYMIEGEIIRHTFGQ